LRVPSRVKEVRIKTTERRKIDKSSNPHAPNEQRVNPRARIEVLILPELC
jgi:hypothetical protein